MNTNQVHTHTLPHLNLTINLWAGLLVSFFTDEGAPAEGICPGHVSQLPSVALRAPPCSPLGQCCKAPVEGHFQNFPQKCHII